MSDQAERAEAYEELVRALFARDDDARRRAEERLRKLDGVEGSSSTLRVSQAEIDHEQLLIKSDVYETKQGGFVWVAVHPPSGWSRSGWAMTPAGAHRTIERVVADALVDQGMERPEYGITISRIAP